MERDQLIIQERKNGKSYREIAKMFGMSHQRVQQIVRKHYNNQKTISIMDKAKEILDGPTR